MTDIIYFICKKNIKDNRIRNKEQQCNFCRIIYLKKKLIKHLPPPFALCDFISITHSHVFYYKKQNGSSSLLLCLLILKLCLLS